MSAVGYHIVNVFMFFQVFSSLLFRNMFEAYGFPLDWNIRLNVKAEGGTKTNIWEIVWLTAVTDLARLISLAHFLRDELDALFRSYFVYWLCVPIKIMELLFQCIFKCVKHIGALMTRVNHNPWACWVRGRDCHLQYHCEMES